MVFHFQTRRDADNMFERSTEHCEYQFQSRHLEREIKTMETGNDKQGSALVYSNDKVSKKKNKITLIKYSLELKYFRFYNLYKK